MCDLKVQAAKIVYQEWKSKYTCVCTYVNIQETGVLQWNNARYITHPWVVLFNCFLCNLSSFFWKLVLKALKTDYSNKFMQMTNPFQLQMRTIYFPIVNPRNIIKINQKSEVFRQCHCSRLFSIFFTGILIQLFQKSLFTQL